MHLLEPLAGCSRGPTKSHFITIAGSTSVQPFAEKLAEIYMEVNPESDRQCPGRGVHGRDHRLPVGRRRKSAPPPANLRDDEKRPAADRYRL